jgi:hypothetical protein
MPITFDGQPRRDGVGDGETLVVRCDDLGVDVVPLVQARRGEERAFVVHALVGPVAAFVHVLQCSDSYQARPPLIARFEKACKSGRLLYDDRSCSLAMVLGTDRRDPELVSFSQAMPSFLSSFAQSCGGTGERLRLIPHEPTKLKLISDSPATYIQRTETTQSLIAHTQSPDS